MNLMNPTTGFTRVSLLFQPAEGAPASQSAATAQPVHLGRDDGDPTFAVPAKQRLVLELNETVHK